MRNLLNAELTEQQVSAGMYLIDGTLKKGAIVAWRFNHSQAYRLAEYWVKRGCFHTLRIVRGDMSEIVEYVSSDTIQAQQIADILDENGYDPVELAGGNDMRRLL